MKLPVILLIVLCFSYSANAQVKKLTYSEPVWLKDLQAYSVIGKRGNEFLTFQKNRLFHKPYIRAYNEQMFNTRTERLKGFARNATVFDFFLQDSLLYVTYLYNEGNRQFYAANVYGPNLKPKGKRIILETINKDSINSSLYLSWSQDKSKVVVWYMYPDNGQLAIHFKIFDKHFKLLDSSTSSYYFNFQTEALSDMTVSNEGDIFFIVRNRSYYYSWYDIIYTPFKGDGHRSFNVALKNKNISGKLVPVYNNVSKSLLVTSFYKNARDTSLVNGLFIAEFDKNSGQMKTTVRPFDEQTRSVVNAGRKDNVIASKLDLRNVVIKKNGGLLLSSEIVSNQRVTDDSRFSNRQSAPYDFDDLWSGSQNFKNFKSSNEWVYTEFASNNYFNRNQYYTNPGSAEQFQQSQTCYENILMFSLDANKELIQTKGIERKLCGQHQGETFVSFYNANNIEMYYNGQDSLNKIENVTVLPDLSFTTKNTFGKEKYPYAIIPSLSRQVSANQAMLVLTHKGYLWYKLEDLK